MSLASPLGPDNALRRDGWQRCQSPVQTLASPAHDIIFSWTRLLGKSHDIRLARKVEGGRILPFWNGSAPHVRVLIESLPTKTPSQVLPEAAPSECHSQTSVLLTATEAGAAVNPTPWPTS